MKILFVWTGVTSYMADCWRKLAAQEGVELKVVVVRHPSGGEFDVAKVLSGLDYALVTDDPSALDPQLASPASPPDVLFAVGWHSKVVRSFVLRKAWRKVPKVCCYDLPWDGSLRRRVARWVLGPFLRHYDAAYVPGLACETYAKRLRFAKIFKGLFSIDTAKFALRSDEARGGFLYLGRFAPEKRLDLLACAYARYRELGGTWPLDLYGSGTLPPPLDEPSNGGPRIHPFVQPDEVPRLYAEHGCLVLASDFDPWPLVVLQACANGMPVVVSDRCTNHCELVRENGILFPHGDVEAMAAAMLRVEREGLRGEAGRKLAEPYDKGEWTRRTLAICRELVKK